LDGKAKEGPRAIDGDIWAFATTSNRRQNTAATDGLNSRNGLIYLVALGF